MQRKNVQIWQPETQKHPLEICHHSESRTTVKPSLGPSSVVGLSKNMWRFVSMCAYPLPKCSHGSWCSWGVNMSSGTVCSWCTKTSSPWLHLDDEDWESNLPLSDGVTNNRKLVCCQWGIDVKAEAYRETSTSFKIMHTRLPFSCASWHGRDWVFCFLFLDLWLFKPWHTSFPVLSVIFVIDSWAYEGNETHRLFL